MVRLLSHVDTYPFEALRSATEQCRGRMRAAQSLCNWSCAMTGPVGTPAGAPPDGINQIPRPAVRLRRIRHRSAPYFGLEQALILARPRCLFRPAHMGPRG